MRQPKFINKTNKEMNVSQNNLWNDNNRLGKSDKYENVFKDGK